ncbi:MAG TPA: hypothetical protein PKH43_06450, partial [Saprospiraceae bacterium]|nr:hypothetical protein [Saprospiraceae bacterium]
RLQRALVIAQAALSVVLLAVAGLVTQSLRNLETADLGFETRTILSGIAEHFTPEEVVGRQVVVLANLAPRVMMGVESQGMILMAENAEGKLCFVSPQDGWANGFGVK